ncbi:MAG: hypothetical protein AMXMBFR34_42050 [Myxococcaceae bacterium]
MSFWNSLKPAQKSPVATQVSLSVDQRLLELTWSDGAQTKVAARTLRQYCPCAECVEEWSGKRTYEVESIPVEMKVVEVNPVGNYALSFTFGDLHRTGIFPWSSLRELSQAHPAR